MAAVAPVRSISFDLTSTDLLDGETVAYFFNEPNRQIVLKHGQQVDFVVNIPRQFPLKPDKVATYITFTGTNSKIFSAENPIPWPFLDSDVDPKTGYQIVLKADAVSKKYTVKQDKSRSVVSYSYSVVVKVDARTAISGPDKDSFFEFRHDPEIYVDEC